MAQRYLMTSDFTTYFPPEGAESSNKYIYVLSFGVRALGLAALPRFWFPKDKS